MTFLNPLVLIGLVAAAIPLIIHLFNFRKPKKVDFSSLEFLQELQRTTMQRMRLKQLLLLILRTAVLVCLVLVFARPTIKNFSGALAGRASSSVVVIVDNSLSMILRDAGGSFLEQAKIFAHRIIDQLQPEDELFLSTTAITEGVSNSVYTSRAAAHEAVNDIQVGTGSVKATRVLARSMTQLQNQSSVNKEIFLISDLQQSTLSDSIAFDMPETVRLVLLPVGNLVYSNVAVIDVQVISRVLEVDQPVQIEATLENYGTEVLEDYVAAIFLGGERIAQRTVNLSPHIRTTVDFTVTPKQRGWLSGIIQIENDAFEQDNVRYFTLYVPERRRILIVQGEEQDDTYLDLSLSPQLTQGRVTFYLDKIPESSLAATGLGNYHVVVLLGPRTLSSGEVASISRYVDEGGGLLIFPSTLAAAEDYNLLLSSLNAGQFTGFSGSLGSGNVVSSFDRLDLEHPLFEGIFESQHMQREMQIESPNVYYAMNYTPGIGAEQALIQLSNGFPFLQEIKYGRGITFVYTVTPDTKWSDLPVRGLFVPLLYRTMYYLSATSAVSGENMLVNVPNELRLVGTDDAEPLRLISPDGIDYTPRQRSLFGAVLLQIEGEHAGVPGVYNIHAGERLVRRIAFNLDKNESDLSTVPPETAVAHLSEIVGEQVDFFEADETGVDGIIEAIVEDRTGTEIWNVFLTLALIFLLMEMIVARQWHPETMAH